MCAAKAFPMTNKLTTRMPLVGSDTDGTLGHSIHTLGATSAPLPNTKDLGLESELDGVVNRDAAFLQLGGLCMNKWDGDMWELLVGLPAAVASLVCVSISI
jgi:hypothetical protein